MNAIAAITPEWGLGRDNQLLFHIKEDMRRFRALTSGGTVIMGRKTLDSMPGGAPLPNRRNIVLTRDRHFSREGAETVYTIEEAVAAVAAENPDKVWVIGGGEIYAQLLPYCHICYLTRVYAAPVCDAWFPNLDTLPDWRLLRSESVLHDGELDYQFVEYVNAARP